MSVRMYPIIMFVWEAHVSHIICLQIKGDVIRIIRSNIEHIGHIHTAGVSDRHGLEDTQELYYPAIARTIVEAGYIGFIGQAFKACEVLGVVVISG